MAIRKTRAIAKVIALTSGAYIQTGKTLDIESDQYIRIDKIEGDKNQLRATYSVKMAYYPDSHGYFAFVPDMNGPNFIKQAYEHLKTLPEFADSEDC